MFYFISFEGRQEGVKTNIVHSQIHNKAIHKGKPIPFRYQKKKKKMIPFPKG